MKNKSVIVLNSLLAALFVIPAMAQTTGGTAQIRSAPATLTAIPRVTPPPTPPRSVDPDQQVCLRDAAAHRLICNTYAEWQRIEIVRSAKENFEAKTVK